MNVMNQLDVLAVHNLKNALYNSIVDALSENTNTRRVAEEKISAMEIIEEFAIHLCDFSQNIDMPFAVRQMSSVLLKQYVDAHWSTTEECHVLCSFVLRNRIRNKLLQGLKEPNSKIRNAFAYCVSYIASTDYPDKWLSFFEDLQELALTNSQSVYGILRVYEELIRDCDVLKINQIAESLLSELCSIFLHDAQDVSVRIATVHVLCLYVNVCNSQQNQMQIALSTNLLPLCKLFVELLHSRQWSIQDYALKTNIIRFITLIVQKNGKHFAPVLMTIMPHIWNLVMQSGDFYATSIVMSKIIIIDKEDEEGKVLGYTPLVLSLFDFIHSLVDSPKLSGMLENVLTDIFYYIITFMHITKNMEEAWLAEPSLFVDDDTTDNFDSTIRITARDVLMIICHDFDTSIVIPHLTEAINRHTSKLQFTYVEWRVHECIMYALGSIKDVIVKACSENLHFPILQLATMWQFALNNPNMTLLFGRTLWFSGKFSNILSQTMLSNYIKYILMHLKDNDIILRMFALRSIIEHSEDFINNCNKHLITNHMPTIVQCLLDNFSNDSDSQIIFLFILNLRALRIILPLATSIAEAVEPRVTSLIINVLMKSHSDPDVINEIQLIVKEYCFHTQSSVCVREKLTPILANILTSADDKVPYGLQTVAMDLLQTLVKCSKPPLSEDLVLIGFPAAIKCMLNCDDQLVMSTGGECLRCYLLIGAEQICNYTDPDGTSGLEYVLRAISNLLDPAHPEEGCKRVGRLIITLINKAGSVLGSHMHFLLRAILSKMQRVEFMDVWQSLLVVFVYLFYTEMEFVVNFLTSVPGPTGSSALEFVLTEWLNKESYFYGSYDRTVSMAALTKLLEYSVTSEDTRLNSIMIPDEIMTKNHSQRKDQVFIPILGKAFKIICSEIDYHINKNTSRHSTSSEESNDTDEETQFGDYRCLENDSDQQDVLYAQDPVFSINMLAHLTDFVQKFKNVPAFQVYVTFLNMKEKNTLATLNVF